MAARCCCALPLLFCRPFGDSALAVYEAVSIPCLLAALALRLFAGAVSFANTIDVAVARRGNAPLVGS